MPNARRVHGALSTLALIGVALGVTACDSPLVTKFKAHQDAQCACADAECAKKEHASFMTSWDEMKKDTTIDWNSSQGKSDTKKIEATTKEYRACLDKHVPAADATKVCQEDEEGKKNTENCTKCCVDNGRFFKSWVDPLAAGLAGALGAGDIKGCTCS